jgi:hypothetical protein
LHEKVTGQEKRATEIKQCLKEIKQNDLFRKVTADPKVCDNGSLVQ